MTSAEVDAFLQSERTCRVATMSPDGPAQHTPVFRLA
jgi:nitroimidazol reductase NimA-like FMN-containing flavoprotein (pyridoxamine 5'-phosphate oxidase superfamily)